MKTFVAAIMMFAASSAFACEVPGLTREEVKAELVAFKKAFPNAGKTEAGYPTDSMPVLGHINTRAEVKADLIAFKKAFPNSGKTEAGYPDDSMAKPGSIFTRAEVKAELKAAKAAGWTAPGELDYPPAAPICK